MSPEAIGLLADVGIRGLCGVIVLLYGFRVLGKKSGSDEKADAWHSKHGAKFQIIGALLILFSLLQLVARHEVFGAAPLKWRRIQLGPVSVEMPGDVKHDVEKEGDLVCKRYKSVFSGGTKQFASSEMDLGIDDSSAAERLRSVTEAFAAQMSEKVPDFKLRSDEESVLFGGPARLLQCEAGELKLRLLAFFKKGRLIRLLYVASESQFKELEVRHFFSSVQEP